MKIAGTGTILIAKVLNDRDIPCPTELYRSRGETRKWKNKGSRCYWTACKVEDIIWDEKYTGTMVQLKTKLDAVGGKQVKRPKEEWVRVENTHEPIITYPQYIRAVASLKQQKANILKISITVGAAAVKREAELFLDRDKLSRQVIKRNSPLSVSERISATIRSIEAAQKSWIALYDKYADGKLEREFFLNEKKKYDADMEQMEEELVALR